MKRIWKKTAAAVTVLALLGCSATAVRTKLFTAPMKAFAAGDMIWNDEDQISGVLVLSGQVTKTDVSNAVWRYGSAIDAVVAEEGAVLPEDCSWMFATHSYGDYEMPSEWQPAAIDLTKADTSQVKNMSGMFYGCYTKKLDLSNFNTANVTDMSNMFTESFVEELDLSSFDTSNVTNMSAMFYNCEKLTELDLSSFDTGNVLSVSYYNSEVPLMEGWEPDPDGMFENCEKLQTIYVSDLWKTDAVTDSEEMFKNCTALTGGNGTVYNSEKTDKEYARIDGGADAPGYLTSADRGMLSGSSLTLDGRIGINFYTKLPPKAAKAVLEGPLGTVEIPAAQFESLRVQDGDYAGCIKLTYGINATQRLNKVTLKLYDSEGSLLDLCKSNYEQLPDKQFSYSAADYIESYQDTDNPALTTLVTALERYFKSAENYFKDTSYEIFPEDYQYQWFDIFNETNGAYKLSLVLNSGTDLRIYSDAEQILIRKTGDTYAALESDTKNGKKYFVIPDIPAQKIVDSREIQIDGETYYVCPRDWCYYAATLDGGSGKLYDLAMAFYEYGKAAEAYLWPNT